MFGGLRYMQETWVWKRAWKVSKMCLCVTPLWPDVMTIKGSVVQPRAGMAYRRGAYL